MLDVSDSLQAETYKTAFYRLTLIFCSHLKHPGKNSCYYFAFLNGVKGRVQQLRPEVVVHPLTRFQVLVQAFLVPFHTSSCFISSQLWLLQEAFLISSLYCLLQLFPCVVLVVCAGSFAGITLFLLLFDCFLASLLSFLALITVPSSLHYLLDLAEAVAAARDENQASDILTPIWHPWCDGQYVYPTLAVHWSAYVFTLATWSKNKPETNPGHCKLD